MGFQFRLYKESGYCSTDSRNFYANHSREGIEQFSILIVTIGREMSTPKQKLQTREEVLEMADIEKNGDEELRERLREAYGYSDTQLEKRLEEAERSLGDTEFSGAGERMFQRIMERKEAEESAAGTAPEPKPVRFRKKKAIMAVALAAAIALTLGSTAIGGKHYFF